MRAHCFRSRKVSALAGAVDYRWKILAMTYFCMFSFAMVFQSIPPLLTLIRDEFGISRAEAGLLMSFFALPGIIVALPGGIISDRFGMKWTGVVSLVLMVIGTLVVGISNAPLQAYVGRIVSGAGGLTLAVVLPQLLSRWFLGEELGVGMGIFNTAMPLGAILSFNIFSIIGESLNWRMPIFLTTTASIVGLSVFLLLFREPPEKTSRTRNDANGSIKELGPAIWLVGLSWMWFNAAFISFLTFSSDFLVTRGYPIGSAGLMSSLVMMGSLFLSPLMGYFVYKFGRERAFIGAGGMIMAFLIFLVPISPVVVPLLVLIGIFVAFVPAPIFSLPSKLVKAENMGLAFGIVTACLNIGVLAGPYFAGLIRDVTGDYSFSFYLMAIFAVLQTVTIALLSLFKLRSEKEG